MRSGDVLQASASLLCLMHSSTQILGRESAWEFLGEIETLVCWIY